MKRIVSRRILMLAVPIAAIASAGGFALIGRDHHSGATLDPEAAFAAARDGGLILIDIRRPDEWMETGMPEHAQPIDMRRSDFLDALDKLMGGDRTRSVALICARGVRSDRMSASLAEAGFTSVIDVPEGMLGSPAGPGWLARGLPVRQP